MKNLKPTSSSVFLNYEIDIKYGPNDCIEEKVEMQVIVYKTKNNLLDVEVEVIDVLDLKVFGKVREFSGWKERKEFMDDLDSMLNINSKDELNKAIDVIFGAQFKFELFLKYGNVLLH